MKRLFPLALVPALLVVSSCSTTPQDRIADNPAAYQQLTQAQKVSVSYGKLTKGMSPEAVKLAWGTPDSIVRSGQGGKTMERWVYTKDGYSFALGVGGGSGWASRNNVSAVGAGVSMPIGSQPLQTKAVVTFEKGEVESWEGQP